MSRRVRAGCGSHMHAAWDSQPILRAGGQPRRRLPLGLLPLVFMAGLLLDLVI